MRVITDIAPASPAPAAATIGMLDGVHLGHRLVLDRLRSLAAGRSLSSLVITFSSHPAAIVRPDAVPPMLTTVAERLSLIEATGNVDYCRLLPFDASLRAMSAREFLALMRDSFGVRLLLMGFDHRFGSDGATLSRTDYHSIASSLGIDLVDAPRLTLPDSGVDVSSSSIRRYLSDPSSPRPELARIALGRPYSVSGKIVKGKQLGHTIGFPTANLLPDDSAKLIPAFGVYVALASLPDRPDLPAIVNIGHRPTVDLSPDAPVSIEAHIIGLDADVYGSPLTLSFLSFLRHEHRFPSLEALTLQLAADRDAALRICN